jgi:hypothetical protein
LQEDKFRPSKKVDYKNLSSLGSYNMKSCLHVKEPGESGRKKSRGDSQSISHCNLENSEIKRKLRSGIKIFEDKQRNQSNLSGVVGGSFAVQPKKI